MKNYYFSNALGELFKSSLNRCDKYDKWVIKWNTYCQKPFTKNTKLYKRTVQKYTEFCSLSLEELSDEAEAEEDKGIKWKKKKIKKKAVNIRQYLLENNSLNRALAISDQ